MASEDSTPKAIQNYYENETMIFVVFAWEAYERGTDVHVQADPTKLEFAEKEFQKRSKEHKETVKTSILEKYGGQEHLDGPPKQLLLAQTVSFGISFLSLLRQILSQTEI